MRVTGRRSCAAARRLAEAEPLLEEAHQEVMRAHLLLGNRPAALATYRSLERALARELSLKPADDSRRLRLAALPPRFSDRSPAAPPPSSLSARLRRIAAEIEELERRAGNDLRRKRMNPACAARGVP